MEGPVWPRPRYHLKADAPDDAVAALGRNLFVPFIEKLLADGTIVEYEVDVEAVHTDNPNAFLFYYFCSNAECLDKWVGRQSVPWWTSGLTAMCCSAATQPISRLDSGRIGVVPP